MIVLHQPSALCHGTMSTNRSWKASVETVGAEVGTETAYMCALLQV